MKLNKPVGLFLCGGGALGSWQSGVLAKLVNSGLNFDVVAGFSVGALNGAAYCYNKTGDLGGLWQAMKPGGVFDLSPRYTNMPLELYQHYNNNPFSKAGFFLQNRLAKFSLFSNKPVYSLLNSWLNRSGAVFKRHVKFYAISHAVEMKLPYIACFNGSTGGGPISFVDALVASCAIPSIFPPVKLTEHGRDYHLVDGGVIGIATINLNIFEGCGTVIMISNTRPEDLAFTGKGFLGYFETKARRMLALHTDKVYESRIFIRSNPEVHLIQPPENLGLGVFDFEGEKCARAFNIGERTGEKFVKHLH
ncbi:MAG: patatin-like phospholipase family protein [Elusimicrobia bacterium]|nr:patatin-like phospholipase family protein [Elusimicrobiota bacterium]